MANTETRINLIFDDKAPEAITWLGYLNFGDFDRTGRRFYTTVTFRTSLSKYSLLSNLVMVDDNTTLCITD